MTSGWAQRATFGLSLAALAISGYLTIAHFTTPKLLACSGNGTIDCTLVTTSAQSRFLGVPVAVLGLVWSIGMVACCSPPALRADQPWIPRARSALSALGMAFVLWLVYAELFVIHAICLWCTVMHVIVFGLFALIVTSSLPLERRAGS